MAKTDIAISGQGFFTIEGTSRKGRVWLSEMVNGYNQRNQAAFCDDQNYTQDIADGATRDGMKVSVNGRLYLGNNRVA